VSPLCLSDFFVVPVCAVNLTTQYGLERYRWGVKKPGEIEKFNFENITLHALEDGDFKGAKVELYHNEEVAKVVARPVDGVAIHNTGDHEFTHFAVEEIRTGRWRDSAVDWRRGIRIFGPDALVEELRAMLAAQGVTPTIDRLCAGLCANPTQT
jgi:hypothetical protein